jgi:sulfatase maturation enzyme AslB (radical SAM superfamily)
MTESKSCSLKGRQKVFYLQKNNVASCCRAYPVDLDRSQTVNDYLDLWAQESQQLDQGIQLDGCKHCWQAEDRGQISYRQQPKITGLHEIELYLSNLCNHMCSYCSPKFSSIWEDSIQVHGQFKNISITAKRNLQPAMTPNNDLDYWLSQVQDHIASLPDDSVSLKLLGGEPLMQQRNLEKLLSLNNNKIKVLSITTNLNPPNNKFLLWILNNFPKSKLKIEISIDATPEYNHIVRAGFDRDRFLTNFALLKDRSINYKIKSVLSVLNIFDLANFEFFDQKIDYSKINHPDCLDPDLVPRDVRQTILKNLVNTNPLVVDVLSAPVQINPVRLLEQYNYLTQYFERAKIVVEEINNELFQTWWKWLKTEVGNGHV